MPLSASPGPSPSRHKEGPADHLRPSTEGESLTGEAIPYLGREQSYCPRVTEPTDPHPLPPSTTWRYEKVRIRSAAGGQRDRSRAKHGFRRLFPQPRSIPVRLEVVYRGGGASWWLVKARGTHEAFPGWMALEDVMARVKSER